MIKYPKTFTAATPANFDGVFDWDFLLPAFAGTKIQPMDLDSVVERKGHVLIFETKGKGVPIPRGQEITLESLIKIGKGKIVVFIIYGKTAGTINRMEEWKYSTNGVMKYSGDINSDMFVARVKKWYETVDNNLNY